jgi:hypothetical protein
MLPIKVIVYPIGPEQEHKPYGNRHTCCKEYSFFHIDCLISNLNLTGNMMNLNQLELVSSNKY